MKRILMIAGCVALAATAQSAPKRQDDNAAPAPRRGAERSESVSQRGGVPAGRPVGINSPRFQQNRFYTPPGNAYGLRQRNFQTNPAYSRAPFRDVSPNTTTSTTTGRRNFTGTSPRGGTTTTTTNTAGYQPRRFNLETDRRRVTESRVTYQSGRRIAGSDNWRDSRYSAFRDYRCDWHDRHWYHRNYDRIVFVFGAPYYWYSGYWYPAWGYDPYASYVYDGPIYAYDDLPPDQVIANVQQALAEQGYYYGDIDGVLGPLTRAAIARYQQDHGLYVTSAIDEPTLQALGMV